jgi:hypothetical protein
MNMPLMNNAEFLAALQRRESTTREVPVLRVAESALKRKSGLSGLAATLTGLASTYTTDVFQPFAKLIDARYVEELAEHVRFSSTAQELSVKQGNSAEAALRGNFDRAALRKGRVDLKTAAGPACHPAVDIKILKNGETVQTAQVKFRATPEITGFKLSDDAYAGVDVLIGPADQHAQTVDQLKKRAKDNKASSNPVRQARGHKQDKAVERLSDHLEYEDVKGEGVTRKTTDTYATGDFSELTRRREWERFGNRCKGAAKTGAVVGGTISAIGHIYKVAKEEESITTAAYEVAKDTVMGAGAGLGTALATEAVEQGLKRCAPTLLRSNAAGAIAGAAVNIGIKACKGELTLRNTTGEVVTAASGWAGAEAGALLMVWSGPIGMGLGALVGGGIGVFGGGLLKKKCKLE